MIGNASAKFISKLKPQNQSAEFLEVSKALVTNHRQSQRNTADYLTDLDQLFTHRWHFRPVLFFFFFSLFLGRQLSATCQWHLAWLPSMHCRFPAKCQQMAGKSWCTHRLTVDLLQITHRLLHKVSLSSQQLIQTLAVFSVPTIGWVPTTTCKQISSISSFDHQSKSIQNCRRYGPNKKIDLHVWPWPYLNQCFKWHIYMWWKTIASNYFKIHPKLYKLRSGQIRMDTHTYTDARTYTELSLWQLCLAHRKWARQYGFISLTHDQRTNFALFKTERVCRRQFQIWRKWQTAIQTGTKHCGKKRNCSLWAISPFPTVF